MAGMEEGLPCGVEGFTPQGRGEGEILPGRLPPLCPLPQGEGSCEKETFSKSGFGFIFALDRMGGCSVL
jgi:hypothetical protein